MLEYCVRTVVVDIIIWFGVNTNLFYFVGSRLFHDPIAIINPQLYIKRHRSKYSSEQSTPSNPDNDAEASSIQNRGPFMLLMVIFNNVIIDTRNSNKDDRLQWCKKY